VSTAEKKTLHRRRRPAPHGNARTRRALQLVLVFFASIVMVDALVGDRGLLAMLRVRHQHRELASSVARQRAENARLSEEVRRLKEDPATIEEIARRELGLIRPGEKLFIIRDLQPSAAAKPAP
jgi:cell division protein FtsB